MFNEGKRQTVHILFFVLAFLLKYLDQWQAAALLAALLFITLFIVPKFKVKDYFYRYSEKKYSQGAVLYFFVLLVLVIIFPLHIVAVSWAILALGDGAATIVGKHFKARELPWNKKKTFAGSLAFLIFGTLGAFILLKWMIPDMYVSSAFFMVLKVTLVAMVVESLPWKINDNVSVTVTSAVVMYLLG